MSEPSSPTASARAPIVLERVKTAAAVLGAVVGALTALYGFYEKVRAEARSDTAASYNTLAPQVNQLGDALKHLQQENQRLREFVAQQQGKPRIGSVPPARRAPVAAAPASATSEKPIAAGGEKPAAVEPSPAASPPVATERAPQAQPAPASDAGAPPQTSETEDPITGLLQTVGRTRAAIESLKKVPDDFGRVLDKKP